MPKLVEEHEFVLTLDELDKVKQRMAQLEKPTSSNKRAKQTWTQQYLADQAHVDLSTAKRFLGRKNEMGESSFRALIQALGFNPDEFSALQSISAIGIDKIRSAIKGMLEDLKKLTTEALTAGDGIRFDFDDVFVPLGVVERQERTKRNKDDGAPDRGSELYEEKVTPITHKEFFEDVLLRGNTRYSKGKRIAVIGEAGAGKTTQLQKIGSWLLEESDDIPVWISLTDLGAKSLREYLFENWVREASGEIETAPQAWKDSLEDAIKSGKVWLLLDGVDEMTVSNPLSYLANQLKEGWLKNVRVVLTCRVNVWDGSKNALTGFDVYRNLDFDYPNDVYEFIDKWFAGTPELARSLRQALEQSGKERIRDMVKNPLRLTLLCYSWQLKQGELPETKAGLYEWFVEAFYKWNKGKAQIELSRSQEEKLNRALGELAKRAIDGETSRFRLTKTFIENVFREFDIDLFDLALKLNWLNEIGVAAENPLETVYAFYHTSFQEYFAALAVDNWDFFLYHNVHNLQESKYRVFQPEWIETIILWFGNQIKSGNINIASDFIYALSDFDDLIDSERIYSYRSHFIATICVAEIGLCELSETIIEKTVEIYLSYFSANIHEAAKDSLKQTNLYLVKLILEKRINECNDIEEIRCLTSLLLEICPTSSTAISSLVNLVNEYYIEANYFQVWRCIDTLIKTNKENLNSVLSVFYKTIQYFREKGFNDYKIVMSFTTIKNISEIQGYHEKMTIILSEIIMLTQANDRSTHWDGLYALAEINPEMIREEASRWLKFAQELQKENAIYSYVNLLLRASESSLEASIALSKLLDSNDFEIVRKCIEHIVDFNNINHKEIVSTGILSKLVKLASSLICNGDEDLIVYHIAEAFGVIGIADQQVIQTLENIIEKIHPEHSECGSSQAAISLNKLGYDISKYESFFEDKLISYPPNIFHIYISTQASIARVLKIINPNNLLATEILLEDVFTHICFSTYSWDSYQYLVETIPYSSIEVLSFIVSFLQNNGKNALKKKKLHSDLYEFEQRYDGLIWLCAQNMSYPDFYKAWHSQPTSIHPEIVDITPSNNTHSIQTLESQLIDCDAIQKELDRTAAHPEIRCLVVDVRQLEQERDPNVIAKKLTNKIFNSIGRRIPVVQDVSCLERELLNLKFDLGVEKLAIALYGKSANEAIHHLCQSLTESIPIRQFTGEKTSEQLTNEVKAWLRRINLEYN